MRYFLIAVGYLAIGLGLLGIFLPLLPTTPFLLLAAACFARASPRLHQALLSNRLLGPYIYDFQVKKGLTRQTKIVAITVLWLSMGFSIYQVASIWLKLLLAAIGLAVSLYLSFGLKTLPRQ